MTVNEAVLEMRYSGIPEEDIEEILEICKKKDSVLKISTKSLKAEA